MAESEPANVHDVTHAHEALSERLRELERLAGASTGQALAELRDQLAAARAELVAHFLSEEQNGYMDALRAQQPRLEHELRRLAEEHRRLTDSLESVIETVRTAEKLDKPRAEQLRRWIESVRRHEAREVDFIQDAANTDIAAAD
jgi:hypothetical protein